MNDQQSGPELGTAFRGTGDAPSPDSPLPRVAVTRGRSPEGRRRWMGRAGRMAGGAALLAVVTGLVALYLSGGGGRTELPAALPSNTPPATTGVSSQPGALPSPTPDAAAMDGAGVAFFDGKRGLLVGSSQGQAVVWRTVDGGRSFTRRLLNAGPATSVAVYGSTDAWISTLCADASVASAACHPSVLRSGDGGETWAAVSSRPLASLSFVSATDGWAVDPSTGYGLGPLGGALVHTIDGGRTWRTLTANPCAGYLGGVQAVSFVTASHGWVGCSAPAGAGEGPRAIVETVDGGRTWQVRASAEPPGTASVGRISIMGYLSGLAMRPDGAGLYWAQRGITEKTTDGARTWAETQPSGFDTTSVLSAALLDDRRWYALVWGSPAGPAGPAGSSPQSLQVSADGGATWTILAAIPVPPRAP